jgi:hypothetical protein
MAKGKDCPSNTAPEKDEVAIPCGHLADGGYFDNSGGHTTSDLLRAFHQHLLHACQSEAQTNAHGQACWLYANLEPVVLHLRNGVDLTPKDNTKCPGDATSTNPRCTTNWPIFADLLGPPITRFFAPKANAIMAENMQEHELTLFPGNAKHTTPHSKMRPDNQDQYPLVKLDLVNDNNTSFKSHQIHFPLGWYLSPQAQWGIATQSCELVKWSRAVDCGDKEVLHGGLKQHVGP